MTLEDPNLQAVQATEDQLRTDNETLISEHEADLAHIAADTAQIADLQGQLTQAETRNTALFGSLLTLPNFQSAPGIIQPGNTGDSGGGSSLPHGSFDFNVLTPNQSLLTCHPAKRATWPADNFYYYWKTAAPAAPPIAGLLHLEFLIPTASDAQAAQGAEGEAKHMDGTFANGFAIQADIAGSKQWRVFDYTNRVWVPTGIPLVFTVGSVFVVDVIASFDPIYGAVVYKNVNVNGRVNKVNLKFLSKPNTAAPWALASVQQDCKPAGAPWTLIVGGQNPNGCYVQWM